MKRRVLSAIALLIICAMTLSACGSKELSAYETACERYSDAEGVSIAFTSTFKTDEGGTATDGTFTGTYEIAHQDGAVSAAHLSGTLSMNISGGATDPAAVEMYYKGGRLYASMAGSKYYVNATWDQARALIGPVGELLTGLAEADFRELRLTEDGDMKKLAFSINGTAADKIPGIKEEWRRIVAVTSAEEPSMKLDVLSGYIITEKKDAASQNISYAGNISVGERTVIVQNTIDSKYTYQAVEISVPDEADYKELNK